MKIAHINYLPSAMAGINKKIFYQASVARKMQLNIDFIVLNLDTSRTEDNLILKKMKLSNNNFFARLKKTFFTYELIEKNIDLNQYDYIIIRYMVPDFSAIKFIKTYGGKIITEHHTNELIELLSYQGLSNKIRFFMEKYRGSKFLNNVSGIIGLTNEIREIETLRGQNKKSIVISNGISVEDTSFTRFKKSVFNEVTIIFVASFTANWHGVDRILSGLDRYNGDKKIKLLLVGRIKDEYIEYIDNLNNKNVDIKVLGTLYNAELDEYFIKSNIAISSLALHRNNMQEACVLKTREYIARGIPFVYGYDDTDLVGTEPFTLKVSADDEPLDMEEIIKFSQKVSQIKDVSQIMRKFAKENLDWKIKIQQMYDFVESLENDKV